MHLASKGLVEDRHLRRPEDERPRLEGMRALITGAGGPMGGAVAGRYAEEGATLVLSDISGAALKLLRRYSQAFL
jgi:3-oxoacyl-[acyl-carrier protein] reductase